MEVVILTIILFFLGVYLPFCLALQFSFRFLMFDLKYKYLYLAGRWDDLDMEKEGDYCRCMSEKYGNWGPLTLNIFRLWSYPENECRKELANDRK